MSAGCSAVPRIAPRVARARSETCRPSSLARSCNAARSLGVSRRWSQARRNSLSAIAASSPILPPFPVGLCHPITVACALFAQVARRLASKREGPAQVPQAGPYYSLTRVNNFVKLPPCFVSHSVIHLPVHFCKAKPLRPQWPSTQTGDAPRPAKAERGVSRLSLMYHSHSIAQSRLHGK